MAYSPQAEKVPPAALPGTAVIHEGGMLRVTGPGFGPEGKTLDPNQVVSTSLWRDSLGGRTVLHVASGDDVVLSQGHADACREIEAARQAR